MKRQRNRRYGRVVFLVLTGIAAVYLTIVFRSFMREAQMSLEGMTVIADTTMSASIINRRIYTPPSDSTLSISQLQFEVEVLEAIDSGAANRRALVSRLAAIFNRHVASVSEYDWIRRMTVMSLRQQVGGEEWQELRSAPSKRTSLKRYLDTVQIEPHTMDVVARNGRQVKNFLPDIVEHGRVITDDLDKRLRMAATLPPQQ